MAITRRRKLSEEELAEMDYNADNIDDEYDKLSASNTVQVPLSAIRQQISRLLEFFIIIQFGIGTFIFFTGIFLLSWAVTPGTAFRSASYMLLAGLIIGRSLLGLVGIHPGRSGALFAYGSLLIFTCVLRTVMIIVCMKILMGSESFNIPPLLSAAPGANSPSIELICAIVEGSQAVCAFYVAWIIDKQTDAERDYNDQQLESILINLRAMQQKRNRHFSEFYRKSQNSNDSNLKLTFTKMDGKRDTNYQNNGNNRTNQQQTQPSQAEIDYFTVYKRYPRQTPTPSVSKSPKPPIEEPNEPEPEVEEMADEIEPEPKERVSEEKFKTTILSKRQLPNRPYTLDYAPAGLLPVENHLQISLPQQQHQSKQQLTVLPHQTNVPNYYSQYRDPYNYYDSVAKTPQEPEFDAQFEPYSRANSPLLYERRNYYGATSSRPANEFQYQAFNSQYP